MRRDTTTIYVQVAQPSDDTTIPSPLDQLYHLPARPNPQSRRAEVGRLRIHFLQQKSESTCRIAKVTLSVASGHGSKTTLSSSFTESPPIYFTGIIAKEVRRGYVTLDITPLERWSEPLSWLTRAQRERFEEPEFYETLQREIAT